MQDAGPRERAGLLSILFHTTRIESEHGPPEPSTHSHTDFERLWQGETVENQTVSDDTKAARHVDGLKPH
jgi:hypothetical protein